MRLEVSCGAVVFTRLNGQVHYVIIQSLSGDYGFPKGHMEKNEAEEETAFREIREEVCLAPRLLPGFRVVDEYLLPSRRDTTKRVVYFLAQYEDQTIVPQKAELRSAELMPYPQARAALTFEASRQILDKANEYILELEKKR